MALNDKHWRGGILIAPKANKDPLFLVSSYQVNDCHLLWTKCDYLLSVAITIQNSPAFTRWRWILLFHYKISQPSKLWMYWFKANSSLVDITISRYALEEILIHDILFNQSHSCLSCCQMRRKSNPWPLCWEHGYLPLIHQLNDLILKIHTSHLLVSRISFLSLRPCLLEYQTR